MDKKYVFLDVDGTLVSYTNDLPASAVSAIRKAREQGHRVYMVTGRSKAEIYDELWEIGFDGYIGGNGNYVESNGEVILHRTLSQEECRQIVDWLHERQLEYYIESNTGLFASRLFEERGDRTVKEYAAFKEQMDAERFTVRKSFPHMIFNESPYRSDVNKISFILEKYEDYSDAKVRFPEYAVGTWGGVGEKALFGDIALKNINKQTAIETLLHHEGADQKNTIAFGDAKVDIPMLEYCEIGVAMGNGGKEIKEMADFVTDSAEQDGLAKAFAELGLV